MFVGMKTPWGEADNVEVFTEGLACVLTPGHGGYCVSKEFAKRLSSHARKRSLKLGGYLWYEEDCDYAVLLWEIPEFWNVIYPNTPPEKIKEKLFDSLCGYNPDYLIAKKVTPTGKAYEIYKAHKLADQMREEKNPDLIVCARGDWHTKIPGITEVTTADGKSYLVTGDSYHELQDKRSKNPSQQLLLSACKLFTTA